RPRGTDVHGKYSRPSGGADSGRVTDFRLGHSANAGREQFGRMPTGAIRCWWVGGAGRRLQNETNERVSEAQAASASVAPQGAELARVRPEALRYVRGVLLLAASYYGAAKLSQTLSYTGSVSAIWPPVGLGIAVLYLWGLRWWPGIFIGECLVNADLFLRGSS